MKFVCDRCQTKYSIADEKVRGKILKVRCKSCANIITVREDAAMRRPSAPAAPVGAAAAPVPTGSASRSTVVSPPLAEPSGRVPSAPARPPTPIASPAVERRASPRPPVPPAEDGVAWYMALDGNRTGPFSRKQLIDHIAPLAKDSDLHVWNERLGAWKPPMDVPALANELHARRRPAVPVPSMPPLPAPPFPGAPRRPTGASAPLAAAPAAAPARPSGAHATIPSPAGSGLGAKLPPPASSGRRSPTGPIPRPAGLAAGPAVTSDEPEIDLSYGEPPPPAAAEPRRSAPSMPAMDSASLLETPAPSPSMHHGLGTNGVGHAPEPNGAHALSNGASSTADRSDGLNVLNLDPGAATPRLMSSDSVVGWEPSAREPAAARQKTTRIVVTFMAVVGATVVVLMFFMMKKPKPVVPPPVATKASTTDPLAAVIENPSVANPPSEPPAPSPAERAQESATAAGRGHSHGQHGVARGRSAPAGGATSPPPAAFAQGGAPPPADDANAKYRDTGNLKISAQTSAPRPPPSQAEISRVINNNRNGIKNCYQRALLRDSSLTHGKITVTVNIGISGRVKHTGIDGPTQFRSLEPCIKEVVGRWAFPPAGEEYGTQFVYVFQGNE
jgi:predicted Zn finger-like uncharacterized protein